MQDPGGTITDRGLASKMIRSSRLTSQQKSQILFNAGGLYDADRIETVLKVSYPRIQDFERKTGQVIPKKPFRPQPRPSHRQGTGAASSRTFRKRVYEVETVEPSEAQDESEGQEEEGGEEELDPAEVYMIGTEDEEEGEEEEGTEGEEGEEQDEEQEGEQQAIASFLAGWRAKQKTAGIRTRRGFVAPKRKAQQQNEPNARSSAGTPSNKGPKTGKEEDKRKTTSRCADCKQLGHWKGDPECPHVKSGKSKPFVKKSPASGQSPHKNYPSVNWVGVAFCQSQLSLGHCQRCTTLEDQKKLNAVITMKHMLHLS